MERTTLPLRTVLALTGVAAALLAAVQVVPDPRAGLDAEIAALRDADGATWAGSGPRAR